MPPPGYRFTRSGPPENATRAALAPGVVVGWGSGWGAACASVWAIAPAAVRRLSERSAGRLSATAPTYWPPSPAWPSRSCAAAPGFASRVPFPPLATSCLANDAGELPGPRVPHRCAPYTYNQNPWVLEIEDPTLRFFFPFIHNGQTCDSCALPSRRTSRIPRRPFSNPNRAGPFSRTCGRPHGWFPRSSAATTIARKVFYVPLGVKAAGAAGSDTTSARNRSSSISSTSTPGVSTPAISTSAAAWTFWRRSRSSASAIRNCV